MTNPRIVAGKRGSPFALAARGRHGDDSFMIGVAEAVPREQRPRFEDRLLEEARSILRMASSGPGFDWKSKGFSKDAEFGVWQKFLSEGERKRLLE